MLDRIDDSIDRSKNRSSRNTVCITFALLCGIIFMTMEDARAVQLFNDAAGDFSGGWRAGSGVNPNDTNNLLGFEVGGTWYSTGVDDGLLSTIGGVGAFTAAEYQALNPSSATSGAAGQGQISDGDIVNFTGQILPTPCSGTCNVEAYLTNGTKGLDMSTFANNVGGTFIYPIASIDAVSIGDGTPDFLYVNAASPSSSVVQFELYNGASLIGTVSSPALSGATRFGDHVVDQFNTSTGVGTFVNTVRPLIGFSVELSEFGTAAIVQNATELRVILPSTADPSFIGLNSDSVKLLQDFGDAPDSYSTLLASGGPSHTIDNNVLLGANIDSDTDGFSEGIDDNGNASDDDNQSTVPSSFYASSTSVSTGVAGSATGGEGPPDGITANVGLNDELIVQMASTLSSGSSFDVYLRGNGTGTGAGTIEVCTTGAAGGASCTLARTLTNGETNTTIQTYAVTAPITGDFVRIIRTSGNMRLDAVEGFNTTVDDEDGATFSNIETSVGASYNLPFTAVNSSGGTVNVGGWIDFDLSGTFDADEFVGTTVANGGTGGNLIWTLPGDVTAGTSYARLRISSDAITSSDIGGLMSDGEVEDYPLTITAPDRSDAPASYGDATHTIVSGVYLGAGDPDADAASLASANADGDDLDGTDDEDGVTLPASFRQGLTEAISVAVTGAGGFLQGWIDWDQSGTFDVGEQVSLDLQDDGTGDDVTAGDGTIELNVAVPAGAAVGTSFARFRWSTTAGLDATTAAADGEVEDYQATIQSLTPFTCEAKLYQVYGFAGVLSEIDLATGTVDIATMGGNLNAFGYRVLNGLAYGFDRDNSHLLVVDANGTKVDLGAVSGLGIAPNVGDFGPDGFLHAMLVGGTTIYRINVDTRTVVDSYTTSSGANSGDWAFDTVTGLFYSIVAANLVSADPVTGTTTVIGPTNVATGSYGAVFADAAGSVFALHNATGQVYWLDTATGNGVLVTSASTATRNDGFSCPDATIPVVDRSDAPASYGDATHSLDSQVRLGSLLDADAVSLAGASTDATGDDVDGVDDEDGVSLPTMVQGETVSISVAATGAGGYLQAWIDWDGNGTFDVGEQIALDLQDDGTGDDTTAADGVIEFDITVPFTAVTSQTFARFRWSTTSGLDTTTAAVDGEVEDYAMIIAPTEVALGDVSLEYVALDDFSIATLRAILNGFEEIADIGELSEDKLRQRVSAFLDPDGDGLVGEFRWETLSQRGTLGFYVERQQSNGTWQRLQSELQPAVIPAPYGAEYRNWDPSAIKGEILIYRLIEQETNGQLKTYGPFQLQ